jgi:hypothetical protein
MKYWTRHGIVGMMGKSGKLSDSSDYFYKNSKNIVSFNINFTSPLKVSYAYIPEKDLVSIPKKTIKSKYVLTQIVSKIDQAFIKCRGKKNSEFRWTRNKYDGKIEVKTAPNSTEEVIDFIKLWDDTRGLKYGWQLHSGYDKTFFTTWYQQEQNIQCLFFYLEGNLVGYSVISLEQDDGAYIYMLGKCSVTFQNLSLYIDLVSYEKLLGDKESILINWGASSGTLLKYKRKFPIYSQENLYFFRRVDNGNA